MKKLLSIFIIAFLLLGNITFAEFSIKTALSGQKQKSYKNQIDNMYKKFENKISKLSQEKQITSLETIQGKIKVLLKNKISDRNNFIISYINYLLKEKLDILKNNNLQQQNNINSQKLGEEKVIVYNNQVNSISNNTNSTSNSTNTGGNSAGFSDSQLELLKQMAAEDGLGNQTTQTKETTTPVPVQPVDISTLPYGKNVAKDQITLNKNNGNQQVSDFILPDGTLKIADYLKRDSDFYTSYHLENLVFKNMFDPSNDYNLRGKEVVVPENAKYFTLNYSSPKFYIPGKLEKINNSYIKNNETKIGIQVGNKALYVGSRFELEKEMDGLRKEATDYSGLTRDLTYLEIMYHLNRKYGKSVDVARIADYDAIITLLPNYSILY